MKPCAKSLAEFNQVANSWHCWQCLSKPKKYNPFAELTRDKYDPNSLEEIEELHEISKILENCCQYDSNTFNKLSKQLQAKNDRIFSSLFNNIDGCASNFDMFVSDIMGKHKHLFPVIGIAETNVDEIHKDLSSLRDYTSTYGGKVQVRRREVELDCIYIMITYLLEIMI